MYDLFTLIELAFVIPRYGGKLTKFTFAPSSVNMMTIEKTLNTYGVNVYGRKLESKGYCSFLVTNNQAEYAEYLCFCANYSKVGTLYPQNEKARGKGLPKRQWEKKGRKKTFIHKLGKLLEFLS